jgi:putative membrane protein
MRNGYEWALAAVCAAAAVASGIHPATRSVWCTEIFWALLVGVPVAATAGKFRFSRVSYTVFAVWVVLQCIGAHYEFEHVPMGWLTGPLGLARNPFDRIAHTCVGFFAYPAAEMVWRMGKVATRRWGAFSAVCMITALAGVWEVIEMAYAVMVGGHAGAAFLGSQGDVWDAQEDILCDFIGALAGAAAWLWLSGRQALKADR